jgi:PIN domain nuclease of toxin-antitoxin system
VRNLLDTSIFITLALFGLEHVKSRKARRVLEDTRAELNLSAVSLTEIAVKHSIGKLDFSMELAREMVSDMKISLLSYTPRHAYGLARLARHHNDPFDRMLIATAVTEDMPIIASEEIFHSYEQLQVIWK